MLNSKKLVIWGFAAAVAVVVGGCDSGREADKTPPPNQPAKVSPPTTVPSTQEASALDNVPTFLFIKQVPDPRKSQGEAGAIVVDPKDDGTAFQFPRARLAFTGKGGHQLTAILFSDDPKEAIRNTYEGDRFIFRMPLQITERSQIDGKIYRFAVPLDGADDTSDGIWRHKDQEHLEPIDLAVQFYVEGPRVKMAVGGLFKQSDPNGGEPLWYAVKAVISAPLEPPAK